MLIFRSNRTASPLPPPPSKTVRSKMPVNVEWTPLNIINHDGETILIRKGDMVKFVALPDEAVGGQFEIEYTLGMDGETVRSPNTRPLIYSFPEAGIYTVSGQYTHGNTRLPPAFRLRSSTAPPPQNPLPASWVKSASGASKACPPTSSSKSMTPLNSLSYHQALRTKH